MDSTATAGGAWVVPVILGILLLFYCEFSPLARTVVHEDNSLQFPNIDFTRRRFIARIRQD